MSSRAAEAENPDLVQFHVITSPHLQQHLGQRVGRLGDQARVGKPLNRMTWLGRIFALRIIAEPGPRNPAETRVALRDAPRLEGNSRPTCRRRGCRPLPPAAASCLNDEPAAGPRQRPNVEETQRLSSVHSTRIGLFCSRASFLMCLPFTISMARISVRLHGCATASAVLSRGLRSYASRHDP